MCGTHGGPKHAKTLMCASNYSTLYVCPFFAVGAGDRIECPYNGHIPKGAELDDMDAAAQVAPAAAAPGIVAT